MTEPLANLRMRYLIGADRSDPGQDGFVTEVGYDATVKPMHGTGVKYCNLFYEKYSDDDTTDAMRAYYGPYLHDSDTAEEYGEGQIDPEGQGWHKNLDEQFARAKSQGFEYIELDNPDAYSDADVAGAVTHAYAKYGLRVLAKNPLLMPTCHLYMSSKAIAGVVVERGAGWPGGYDSLRRGLNRPLMPVWFVFYGKRWRSLAQTYAQSAARFPGMSVSFSSRGEYESSEQVVV